MNIILAGDFVPNGRIAEKIANGQSIVDENIVEIIKNSDYAIINLEAPIVSSESVVPMEKLGPSLCCNKSAADCLLSIGFNCVTLANNHFLDYGKDGVVSTIKVCKSVNLDFVGGGESLSQASNTLYKRIGDKVLAVINCCEHEFSIATESSAGSNPLNVINQYHAIIEAKQKADFIIVIVHGGHETCQFPSIRMQETYRFFIDIGADAVVNHHQHCYSGYEVYKNKPIFYGLGNFCFDSFSTAYGKNWHYGYLLSLNFCEEGISYELFPYSQCLVMPEVRLIDDRTAFNNSIDDLNRVIRDKGLLETELSQFYLQKCNYYDNLLEPKRARSFLRFFFKGRVPKKLLNWRRKYQLINCVECESHRDVLLYFLKNL